MKDDDRLFLLVLDIEDLDRLEALFGETALAESLVALEAGFSEIGARVLARHQPLPAAASQVPGRWIAPFLLAASELMEDPDEQRDAIAASASRLQRELFEKVFGTATGSRLPYRLAVLDAPRGRAAEPAFLDTWLHTALASTPVRHGTADEQGEAALRALLKKRTVDIHLQPIVAYPAAEVTGFEALARGPAGTSLERPDHLLGTADRFGLRLETERLCVERALEAAAALPAPYLLTVNAGPDLLADPGFVDMIRTKASDSLRRRLMVELTEHMPLDQAEALRAARDRLVEAGVRLALDDTGCGYADVETAKVLRPHVVKLGITIVRLVGPDADVMEDVRATIDRFAELGASVLAEGVETGPQAATLAGTGIHLVQGWHFGKPRPAAEVLADLAARIPLLA